MKFSLPCLHSPFTCLQHVLPKRLYVYTSQKVNMFHKRWVFLSNVQNSSKIYPALWKYGSCALQVGTGNGVFRQCVGILMGTDYVPLLANLYLFYYEYRFTWSLLKNNLHTAKQLCRYIDDLLTLNNPSFVLHIYSIYPPELVLKKTIESSNMVSYLDVCITIFEGKYVTSVYNKRDDFNFKIDNFPILWDSNIPARPSI